MAEQQLEEFQKKPTITVSPPRRFSEFQPGSTRQQAGFQLDLRLEAEKANEEQDWDLPPAPDRSREPGSRSQQQLQVEESPDPHHQDWVSTNNLDMRRQSMRQPKLGITIIPKMKNIAQNIKHNTKKRIQRRENEKLVSQMSKMNSIQEVRRKGLFLKPDGVFINCWETVKFVLLIYQLIYLPFRLAFFSSDGSDSEDIMDIVFDIFLGLDIVVTFFTPVFHKYEIAFDHKVIAEHYLLGWFLPDFISIFPFNQILQATVTRNKENWATIAFLFKFFRFIRLIKLIRLVKSMDSSKTSENYLFRAVAGLFAGTPFYNLLPNLCINILFMHLFACFWYSIADANNDNNSWLQINQFQDEPIFDKYIVSIYFVIQTFTTTGYGDILSVTKNEIATRIVMMILSVMLYGLFSGQVVNYRTQAMEREENLAHKTQLLAEIRETYQLDEVLYRHLLEKLQLNKWETKLREHDLSVLAKDERDQLDYQKFLLKFAGIRMFNKNLDLVDFQLRLGRNMKKKVYQQDQIIYSRGEAAVLFYIIAAGAVGVMMEDIAEVPVILIKKGYFGENEILWNAPRKHTIKALTNCLIYYIDSTDFKKIFMADTRFCAKMRQNSLRREMLIADTYWDICDWIRRKVFWKLVLRNHSGKQKKVFNRLVMNDKFKKKKSGFLQRMATLFSNHTEMNEDQQEVFARAESTNKFEE
jgi:hypothetical protein